MATYVRADLPEVATALAALTGEGHPLAVSTPSTGCPNRACTTRKPRRHHERLLRPARLSRSKLY